MPVSTGDGVLAALLGVALPAMGALVKSWWDSRAAKNKSTDELTASALGLVSEDGRLTRAELREAMATERRLNDRIAEVRRERDAAALDSARHAREAAELASALRSILDHAHTVEEAHAYARRVLPAPEHSLSRRMRSETSPSGLITLEEVSES